MTNSRRLGLALLVLGPLVLQLAVVRSRGIDPDELEHLHAAYSVSRGLVPYRDFFEHHSPALYYLLQPAFWLFGANLSVLWSGRIVMCGLSGATVVMTWFLAKRLNGEPAAWMAAVLLSWSSVFVLKGAELRPDVPACLLITVMVGFAMRSFSNGRLIEWLGIGLLGGLATLFTQKSIVPVVSMAVSLLIAERVVAGIKGERGGVSPPVLGQRGNEMDFARRWRYSPSFQIWTPFIGIGLGGTFAWIVAGLAFAEMGAFDNLVDGTLWQLLRWPMRSERWEHLRPVIAADLILWLGGLLQMAIVLFDVIRRKVDPIQIVIAGTLAGCLSSLTWVKAVYPQIILLWLPLLAIAAGSSLNAVRHSQHARVRYAVLGLLLLLCPLECWLLYAGLGGAQASALPNLRTMFVESGFPAWAALILPVGVMVWGVFQCRAVGQMRHAVISLVALGMCYCLARDANVWLWPNRDQVRRIERVNQIAGPDGTVLDGFSGYGALRRHAYYYWWINRYSLALMPIDHEQRLLSILDDHPPEVILHDPDLKSLSRLKIQIETDYKPSELPPIWIQKKRRP